MVEKFAAFLTVCPSVEDLEYVVPVVYHNIAGITLAKWLSTGIDEIQFWRSEYLLP